jgi:tyrosyl-tRNA synthetase
LKLLTFLPIEQIEEMEKTLTGEALNSAKEILAYEVTALVHGEEKAKNAQDAAKAVFSGGGNSENMPTTKISKNEINILDLLVETGLAPSKGEARRLVQQGGISIDDVKIPDISQNITVKDFVIVKKGKKIYHKVTI